MRKVARQKFIAGDRVVWRNRRGRLCHGIVQTLTSEVLIIEESIPVEPKKAASVYDDAFFKRGAEWEVVSLTDVLRKQNL